MDTGGVTAFFTLDAKPEPSWQGAFARAFDGRLGDAAGRWRFDGPAIVVTRVRSGRAANVATAVQRAVHAANASITSRAEAADAASQAAVVADADLQRESAAAAHVLRDALGV